MSVKENNSKVGTGHGILRWILKMVVSLAIYGAILFTTAGSLAWKEGWAYFGVILLTQVLTATNISFFELCIVLS